LEDPICNPAGLSQPPVILPGVNVHWIAFGANGTPYSVCFDQPPSAEISAAVTSAVADWEAALPGTQFDYNCSTGDYPLQVVVGAGVCGGAGCVNPDVYFDSPQLGGAYTISSLSPEFQPAIGINTQYTFASQVALRATFAHELGHILALHEAYLHDPRDPQDPNYPGYPLGSIECNPADNSVMDTLSIPSPLYVDGPCPGGTGAPTAADIADVQDLYRPDSLVSIGSDGRGSDIEIRFAEGNLGEWGYNVYVYQSTGPGSWTSIDAFPYISNIAPKDQSLTFLWRKNDVYSAGSYMFCLYPNSAIYPNYVQLCLTAISSGGYSHDSDGDGTGDIKEAGTPACDDSLNSDPNDPQDNLVNEGCPLHRGQREIQHVDLPQCTNATDDDDSDGVVNDGCPLLSQLDFSEASIRTGTNPNRRCSATATANDEPVDSHPMDNNDDRRTDLSDISALTTTYNKAAGHPAYMARHDVNTSGVVDLSDVSMFSPYYNQPPCVP
jgi:hypothetical protein